MRKTDKFAWKTLTGALALGMAMAAAQAGAESIPQVVQVVKVEGSAQYSTDGRTWNTLSQGDVLKSGVVIRTAERSWVDVLLGEEGSAAGPFSGPNLLNIPGGGAAGAGAGGGGGGGGSDMQTANVVRIFQSTVLGVDKLTLDRTGVDEVSDTQLDLRAGQIMGNVKKLSAESHYEIKIPNGVAGIRGTPYLLSSSGTGLVLKGPNLGGKCTEALTQPDGSVATLTCGPGQEIKPNPPRVEQTPQADEDQYVGIFLTLPTGGNGPGPRVCGIGDLTGTDASSYRPWLIYYSPSVNGVILN